MQHFVVHAEYKDVLEVTLHHSLKLCNVLEVDVLARGSFGHVLVRCNIRCARYKHATR